MNNARLQSDKDALLTRKEAGDLLSVSAKTIDKWAKDGRFKTYRLGREVRYLKSELVGAWKAIDV